MFFSRKEKSKYLVIISCILYLKGVDNNKRHFKIKLYFFGHTVFSDLIN